MLHRLYDIQLIIPTKNVVCGMNVIIKIFINLSIHITYDTVIVERAVYTCTDIQILIN